MRILSKRVAVLAPALLLPIVLLLGAPSVGCELLVNDVDLMLVDGSPVDVLIPMGLDGYACKICTNISPDADLDGDLYFPEGGPKDDASEGAASDGRAEAAADAVARDAGADGSSADAGSE
jgi:hypothetical protein